MFKSNDILKTLSLIIIRDFIFGGKIGKGLSDGAMLVLLKNEYRSIHSAWF